MKRFLSFSLAVLMVVGVMIPFLTLLISAEGEGGEADPVNSVTSEIPHLIITELATNAVSHSSVFDVPSQSTGPENVPISALNIISAYSARIFDNITFFPSP